jgi:alpha-L-fucosidase 2
MRLVRARGVRAWLVRTSTVFGGVVLLACLAFTAHPRAGRAPQFSQAVIGASTDPPPSALTLWYTTPANAWLDALPIGNGRLGAMVFGKVDEERVQLNENTLWDGFARETTNPEALTYLPEVQRRLFAGRHADATALVSKLLGNPARVRAYQTLGDLLLAFDLPEPATNYRRELDLAHAVTRVSYTAGGVTYRRELFASAPDRVIVMRLTADKPGRITTRLRLQRAQDARTSAEGGNRLVMRGQIERRETVTGENRGLRFGAQLVALPDGGSVRAVDDGLTVEGANAVTLLIAAATSYREPAGAGALASPPGHGPDLDPDAICQRDLAAAATKPYEQLRAAHERDYRRYFDRVSLDLGPQPPAPADAALAARPTDERLAALRKGGADEGLIALYFQMGRYLLISSSRPGHLPANLQGLWNDSMNPPWNADYHTNINLQMNYWPAEVTNLSELHQPLFDYVRTLLVPSGQRTAKVHYNARGWVVHHLSDAWGHTTPADGVQGVWPMGAAWLAQHFWEHYAFTRDRAFLAEQAYPVMKGAAEFMLDFLVPDSQGRLVTNPSFSPENTFALPDGSRSRFTYAATMDLEIIHDLFANTIAAAEALGQDAAFRQTLQQTMTRLPPLQISRKTGRLQEWIEDYDEPEPGHRHMSHLFALYPGRQLTLRGAPELTAAARASLEYRLSHDGGQTGWSRAWIINFYARLQDGARARASLAALLADNTTRTLLDLHPPQIFQIDGNLGATAGVAEMLLQSHEDGIRILPALPAAWRNGRVTGLRARGGYTVDIDWREGRPRHVAITAQFDGPVRVSLPGSTAPDVERIKAGETLHLQFD